MPIPFLTLSLAFCLILTSCIQGWSEGLQLQGSNPNEVTASSSDAQIQKTHEEHQNGVYKARFRTPNAKQYAQSQPLLSDSQGQWLGRLEAISEDEVELTVPTALGTSSVPSSNASSVAPALSRTYVARASHKHTRQRAYRGSRHASSLAYRAVQKHLPVVAASPLPRPSTPISTLAVASEALPQTKPTPLFPQAVFRTAFELRQAQLPSSPLLSAEWLSAHAPSLQAMSLPPAGASLGKLLQQSVLGLSGLGLLWVGKAWLRRRQRQAVPDAAMAVASPVVEASPTASVVLAELAHKNQKAPASLPSLQPLPVLPSKASPTASPQPQPVVMPSFQDQLQQQAALEPKRPATTLPTVAAAALPTRPITQQATRLVAAIKQQQQAPLQPSGLSSPFSGLPKSSVQQGIQHMMQQRWGMIAS